MSEHPDVPSWNELNDQLAVEKAAREQAELMLGSKTIDNTMLKQRAEAAEKACAEMRAAIQTITDETKDADVLCADGFTMSFHKVSKYHQKLIDALKSDAGRDYIHRSEAEKWKDRCIQETAHRVEDIQRSAKERQALESQLLMPQVWSVQAMESKREMNTELFPPSTVAVESPRLRWMKRNGVCVESCDRVPRHPDDPRMAYDFEATSPSSRCNGLGDTKDEAIADWARRNGVRLWNEGSAGSNPGGVSSPG